MRVCFADLRKIFETPLKIRLVREHAEARRPMCLERASNRHRIEIGPNHAGRRTGLFHLGDEFDRPAGSQRGEKIAQRRRVDQPVAQLRHRHSQFEPFDLGPLRRDNLI